jgi:hypothetical protein
MLVVMIVDQATATYSPAEGSAGTATIELGTSKAGPTSVAQAERLLNWNERWDGVSFILSSYSPSTVGFLFG